jgi:TatD DNase family protein
MWLRQEIEWVQTVPMYAAIGVHPNEASAWMTRLLIKLERLPIIKVLPSERLVWITIATEPSEQREVLEMQLNLAARHNLPVILHNRDASQDLIAI